jgi:hypothetical protein
MSIDLSDNNPRVEYSVAQGVTQTSFTIPFEFFDDSDVNIYVDGVLKTEGVDYTLAGGDGSTGTATIIVTGAFGGSTVIIVRRIALERVTDFTAGADINRAALNQQLDSLVAIAADLDDRIDRSIHIPDSDPADITFELPVKSERASKYLAFGADGGVAVTSGTSSDIIVSTFAETFLDDASGTAVLNTLGVTSTPAELNILDGVTSNASELNLLDGKTLSGSDAVIITGTAGASGQVAQWNADGDVVGYTIPTAVQATWEAGTNTTESLVSPAKVKAAIDEQRSIHEDGEDATTSGTAHNFTGIPAGINEIDILLDSVSASGTNDFLIQIGTGGSPTTTGYFSSSTNFGTNVTATSGFAIRTAVAANTFTVLMQLRRIPGSNKWVSVHTGGTDGLSSLLAGTGYVTLAGVLDNIRLRTSISDTFDAGTWSIRCRK